MKFSPNSVTEQDGQAIVAKFKEHNKGVVLGRYLGPGKHLVSSTSRRNDWDSISAKWADVTDSNKYSIGDIKRKMRELYGIITCTPEDEVLGDSSIAFTHRTKRNQTVNYTYTDMYIFLREALRERMATQDYVEKQRQLEEAKAYVEKHKPQDKVLEEKQKLIEELEAELDDSSSQSDSSGNS